MLLLFLTQNRRITYEELHHVIVLHHVLPLGINKRQKEKELSQTVSVVTNSYSLKNLLHKVLEKASTQILHFILGQSISS